MLLTLILLLSAMVGQSFAIDYQTQRMLQSHAKIKKIIVEGNKRFSEGDIRSHMYSREHTFWNFIKPDRRTELQRETLNRDTLEVKYLYMKDGYLGVKVKEEFALNTDDSTVVITVNIEEGRQYHYGVITLTGAYPVGFTSSFRKMINHIKPGKPINPFDLTAVTNDMEDFMANRGYPYGSAAFDADTANCLENCPILFRIRADSLVHFGHIKVEGTKEFPEYVARRELKIKPGALYRADNIVDSKRRLWESGYFRSFTLTEVSDSANRLTPNFLLRVRETKPYYITTTTGAVGQSEFRDLSWAFTGGFGKRNLFGSRRLDLSAEYLFSVGSNTRLYRHIYQAKYTEPWFLGIRMPLVLAGQYRPRIQSELQNYKIQSWSVSTSTWKNFGQRTRLEFGLEYQTVDITGVPPEQIEEIKKEEGTSNRRRLYSSFRRDTRDHPFTPTRGSVTDLTGEYVGGFLGGDDSFTKLVASWSRYQIAWPGWIAATRFKVGRVRAFGKSIYVPTDDRFYLGGANTVRGFKELALGPQLPTGGAAGGNYLVLFNQEFRWKTIQIFGRIPLIQKFPLWQTIFFDMGNVFRRIEDINFNNFAFSYGTGVQFMSPAGPIRIDYGRIIPTERYSPGHRWHFTILYAF
jgi:outer membrane protein insertion porin family